MYFLATVSHRESSKFIVDANIEPEDKVVFKLTYDEVLDRVNGIYEYALNINPGQVVDDFNVEVQINESLPLINVQIPKVVESNEIDFTKDEEEEDIVVKTFDDNKNNVKIVFAPDEEYQKAAGDQGVFGKFVVRYDVDRSDQVQDSQVQVIDGYFVHFFAPQNLQTLSKHVIFVLDVRYTYKK